MNTSLTVCVLVLQFWAAGPHFNSRDDYILQFPTEEELHRERLEHMRRYEANTEMCLKWAEKMIKHPINGPAEILLLQREIEECRGELEFARLRVRALEWYEQERKTTPGLATDQELRTRMEKIDTANEAWLKALRAGRIAPMPREVKSPIAP